MGISSVFIIVGGRLSCWPDLKNRKNSRPALSHSRKRPVRKKKIRFTKKAKVGQLLDLNCQKVIIAIVFQPEKFPDIKQDAEKLAVALLALGPA